MSVRILCWEVKRRERKAEQQDLKVDPKTLYRYENGKQCPNVYVAMRLSEYYHRTVPELFPPQGGLG